MTDALKGLARGLTADWLGSPVDMATQVANLGVAGTGYLAHKLRLINQPPDLIDPAQVPFSSDWLSKGTPLQDTGSASYTAGRLTGNLAPGLRAMATPKIRHGQTNALYPGGDDSLLLSHSTKADSIIKDKPKEFYHLSSAITKDRIPDDFGDVAFILNPKKFDPKTSTSVIANRDAYTPRYSSSKAEGRYEPSGTLNDVLELKSKLKHWEAKKDQTPPEQYAKVTGYLKEAIAAQSKRDKEESAIKRLSDRFLSYWPKGGVSAEGSSPGAQTIRDKYVSQAPEMPISDGQKAAIQQSPRFQHFRHYEKNPAGSKRLTWDDSEPELVTEEVMGQWNDDVSRLFTSNPNKPIFPLEKASTNKKFELMKKFASMTKKEIEAAAASGNLSKAADDGVSIVPVTADDVRNYVSSARANLQTLRQAPSNYAEVKTYGATPINKETIAAIYAHPNRHPSVIKGLREYADSLGVPLIEGSKYSREADFARVVQEQNRVQKRRP